MLTVEVVDVMMGILGTLCDKCAISQSSGHLKLDDLDSLLTAPKWPPQLWDVHHRFAANKSAATM